jgi:hypothetical protein
MEGLVEIEGVAGLKRDDEKERNTNKKIKKERVRIQM